MRRVLFFILLIFIPYMAYGVDDTAKYNTTEQDAIVSKLKSDSELMKNFDEQEIRDFINNEDPEFINNISNLGEYDQRAKMREWLAKKAFGYFYDKYMAELKTQSEKTGRAIKTELHSSFNEQVEERHYWLDREQLDKNECKQDVLKRQACDYPDGFEEYHIVHKIYPGAEILNIEKDDISTDTSVYLEILFHFIITGYSEKQSAVISITADGQTEKYSDHQHYRNQEAADIRAGKYRKPTKEEQKKYSTGNSKLRSIMDDSREWESNNVPSAMVTGFALDYEYDSNHSGTN